MKKLIKIIILIKVNKIQIIGGFMKRILFTFILIFVLIFVAYSTAFATAPTMPEPDVIIRVENTTGTDLGSTIHVDENRVFTGKMVMDGTLSVGYSNLGTNVEVLSVPTGGTVTVVGTDEHGTDYTIITNGGVGAVGMWGHNGTTGYALPAGALPVSHTTTPIKVTFSEAGTYRISVTLIDLSTSTVLQTRTFTIVVAAHSTANNTTNNNSTVPGEIPNAGSPVMDYAVVGIIVLAIFVIGYYVVVIKRKDK